MLGLHNLRDEDLKWWQRSARAKGVRSIDAVPTRVLQCSSKEQCGGCTADYFITLEQRTVQSGRGELRLDLIHHITGKPGVKTTFPRKSRVVSSNNLALCKSSPGRYIKSKNPFKARTYNFFELSTYLLWRTTFKAMFYPLRLFWTKLIFNMIFFLKKTIFFPRKRDYPVWGTKIPVQDNPVFGIIPLTRFANPAHSSRTAHLST